MDRDSDARLAAALALHQAAQDRREAEQAEVAALLAARAQGLSFGEIGERMGITRQAAHQRYRSLAAGDAA